MPTATLTTATLETVGKAKPSKYEGKPDYRPCLFKLASGSDFWKSYPIFAEELTWLKKGQQYQVAIAGDDYTIIKPDETGNTVQQPTSAVTTTEKPPGIPDSQKQAIATYAQDMAKLYAYCHQQAAAALPGADSETIRAAGSSIFIACQRRFNLA